MEVGLVRSLQPRDILLIQWGVYNSIANTSKGVLFLPPSDVYVRSFLYLLYTLIKLYYIHTHTHTHTEARIRARVARDDSRKMRSHTLEDSGGRGRNLVLILNTLRSYHRLFFFCC